jgi:hypothetical protein
MPDSDTSVKKFVLAIVGPITIFLVGQTIAAVWWASAVSTAQKFMTDQLSEQKTAIEHLANKADPNPVQDQQISVNRDAIADIRARLSLLERSVQQPKP